MPRPTEPDPKVQRNIYPPTSVWDELVTLASKDEFRPSLAQFAVAMLERGIADYKRQTGRKATAK